MQKLKYFGVFIVSSTVIISFISRGIWTYLPIIFSFVLIPFIELLFKPDPANSSAKKKEQLKKDPFFNLLLYSIVLVQVGFLVAFLFAIQEALPLLDLIGRITAFGIMCGIFGINVGHELGHKKKRWQQFLGEILLLTSLETHFLPYHNSGHHYNVATPKDPATARKNESVFTFWFRSQIGSYFQAWQLEGKKLNKKGKSYFSTANRMLFYTIFQVLLLCTIYFFFDGSTVFLFICAALFGIAMLETVNYIEHYGLLRKKNDKGRYERVQPHHSWNSDHQIGRSILFELSRHSDHHYKANKSYQLLDSMPNSPQMITGYPGMMILALCPPLWFKVMNKKLENFRA